MQAALAARYSIIRELGRGATATVYLARDLKQKNRVAIKVLAEEFSLAVRTERFQGEIEIAAPLTHPHILPVHDSGSAAGLLYYVMPYMEGGTVADRLAREGPLPVDDAVRIASEAADALDYAHRQNVIHRDIKPGNILLAAGHAWVADFGIARAIEAGDTGMTATGTRLGTPAYMSPEQVTGDHALDGRTDIYSLGCTLFEMLSGATPFQGPDVQSTLTRRVVEPPPSVRSVRPDVPAWLDEVLRVALATKPADRFPTARAFGEALERKGAGLFAAQPTRPARLSPRLVTRRVLSVVTPVVAIIALVVFWPSPRALDPNRIVVLPVEGDGTAPAAEYGEALLHDEFSRWSGISVVDRQRMHDALGESVLDGRAALRLAARLGAGRYVRTDVSPFGDSTRVHVMLYDVAGDSVLRERTIRLGPGLVRAVSSFAALVDQLLFNSSGAEPSGTHSYPARLAFERGRAAVQEWELPKADSAFRQATDSDPDYAQAHLWLAQVRFWSGATSATWASSAERAAAARARLSASDQAYSDALLALSHGAVPRACATWDQVVHNRSADFAGWYGLANCLKGDAIVVRDRTSLSGWRFRSSYHHALKAYQRAFQLLPAIHRSLRSRGYETVRDLLMTTSFRRWGQALAPDTTTFRAVPTWQGDSLVLVPFPAGTSLSQGVRSLRPIALRRQRALFREIATAWVTAYPRSAAALEALAVSLELAGEPASLDTLRRARRLEPDVGERRRLAMCEVWLQLKLSIPSDVPGIVAARRQADSLLSLHDWAPSPDLRQLASLAAVTGRADLAASLAQDGYGDEEIIGPLARIGPAFLAYAAMGGPGDSLQAYERRVIAAIENLVPQPERDGTRMAWLARPVSLAFPQHRLASVTDLAGIGHPAAEAAAAYARGDSALVLRILESLRPMRAMYAPADITFDALYPEAYLFAAIGQDQKAIRWLDPTINVLTWTPPRALADPARAGALVRAMVLRADLARNVGDRDTAQKWARVVATLWSDADPFLMPTVQRMKRLALISPR